MLLHRSFCKINILLPDVMGSGKTRQEEMIGVNSISSRMKIMGVRFTKKLQTNLAAQLDQFFLSLPAFLGGDRVALLSSGLRA